jgi:hypothetical protein
VSLKNICRIPRTWNLEEYRRHTCTDRSHLHFSRSQIAPYEAKGLVIWLLHPIAKNDAGVCVIVDHVAEIDSLEWLGSPMNTGLSARVGEYLAVSVYRKQTWANVMLSEITGSRSRSMESIEGENKNV